MNLLLVVVASAAPPVLVAPADHAELVAAPVLQVVASERVAFYGRRVDERLPGDFVVVVLPDTQYYSCGCQGGDPATFSAQTAYAVAEAPEAVIHLGDCVEHGDAEPAEWLVADDAMSALEDPVATGRPDGIPYGIAVGNHDQTPANDPTGSTAAYNATFGVDRFASRPWYGGPRGADNDDSTVLFDVGSLGFVVVFLEYDSGADAGRTTWAVDRLRAHPDRHAIVVSHYLLDLDGAPSVQGAALLDALEDEPNLLLLLTGHVPGEGRRDDLVTGRPVATLLSDYQMRTGGGDGWLRRLVFSPSTGRISVTTYSPTLGDHETDADSEFVLDAPIDGDPWVLLGFVDPVDGVASLPWAVADGTWSWRAVAGTDAAGPWSFTTSTRPTTSPRRHAPLANDTATAPSDTGGCGCGQTRIGLLSLLPVLLVWRYRRTARAAR